VRTAGEDLMSKEEASARENELRGALKKTVTVDKMAVDSDVLFGPWQRSMGSLG
jgi:hypothetical protein